MPQCPKCRDMVAPGETYCPNCGTPVPPEPETPESLVQPLEIQPPVYQPVDQSPVYQQPDDQPVVQQPVYPQPAAVQPQCEQQPATPQYLPQQPAVPQASYAPQPQFFQPPAPQPGYPPYAPEMPAQRAPRKGRAAAILSFVFGAVSACMMLVLLRAFLLNPILSGDTFFITGQLMAQALLAAVGLTFSTIALCRNTKGQLLALFGMSLSLSVIAAFLAAVLI